MVCTVLDIKMSPLKDLHSVGFEGPRTSFVACVFSPPAVSLMHFTTSGERQGRLEVLTNTLQKGKHSFKGNSGK